MACQALGRCRICSRKHKIPVFGGEKSQHCLIEKANLKLIILNTVCIACIAKIERFMERMDSGLAFHDFMKEDECDFKQDFQIPRRLDVANTIKEAGGRRSLHELDRMRATKCSDPPLLADAVETRSSAALLSPPERSTFTNLEPPTRPEAFQKNVRRSHKVEEADDNGLPLIEPKREENCISQNCFEQRSEDPPRIMINRGAGDSCLQSRRKHPRDLFCEFCEKKFTHAGDLNKHRRKHTGERPYECSQCHRKFAHASNLGRHRRVHSGEKPFSCPRCDQSFTRKDKLANHMAGDRCRSVRVTPI